MAERNLNPSEIAAAAVDFIAKDGPRARKLIAAERAARVLLTTRDLDRAERVVDYLSNRSERVVGLNLRGLTRNFLGTAILTGLAAYVIDRTFGSKYAQPD